MPTIRDVLDRTARRLRDSDAPRLDAERLLGHVLRQSESSWLYAHGDDVLPPAVERVVEHLIAERAAGKPLAYILGEAEFYGRSFIVTPDVLIPRPSTEALVEAALTALRTFRYDVISKGALKEMVIADIGTGSGSIAVTLACELANFQFLFSNFQILATDISEQALVIARQNAERHGVADQIEFLQGDMLTPLADRHVDLIVSNPPYVPTAEVARAGQSVNTTGLLFEPRLALDGGSDGQRYIEQIKTAGIPAVVEGVDGHIFKVGL